MKVIDLGTYKEYKSLENSFEEKYLKLLTYLGTPKNILEINKNFYCCIRYLEGMINSIKILSVLDSLKDFELEEMKEQMIKWLQGIIEDIKEI